MDTDRLLLRQWRDADRAPFAALNADPDVMRYFPAVLGRAESDALVDRASATLDARGYSLWALEERATGEFIGFTGLWRPTYPVPTLPGLDPVEVGWRLRRESWGRGYASEAAEAALRYAFTTAGLAEVVSFAAPGNARSLAVMARLGLTNDPADDFDHPDGRRLLLHRMTADRWRRRATELGAG